MGHLGRLMLCWAGMLDEEENRDNLVTEDSELLEKATQEAPNPDKTTPFFGFIAYESVAQLKTYVMHPYEHSQSTKANVFA